MSRLEQMIKELCLEGVEYKALEECCIILDSQRKPVTKSNRETGAYPYYGANGIQDYVSNYIFDGTFVLVGEDGSVMNTDGSPVVTWATGKIWVNNHAHIIAEKDGVLLRYLYHYLQTINVRTLIHGNIPKLTGGDFRSIIIPIPPKEIQKEIVRILDKYSAQVDELNRLLKSELEARKKQYEYYRDKLLDFGTAENERGRVTFECEWRTLGEISMIVRGASPRPIKNFITNDSNGIPWIKIGDVLPKSKYITNTQEKITKEGAEKSRFVHKGDFILSNSMSFGRPYILKIDGCIHDGWLSISGFDKYVSADYLYYALTSGQIQQEMKKRASFGGAVQNLNSDIVKAISIPIPPKKEQERIVAILDRFDKLCNDIYEGLPAEIEARKKQYEYYRDRLLSFKER